MTRLRIQAIFIFLILVTTIAFGQNPSLESELQQKLVGNYLTLRTPYAGEKLAFAANGSPVGKPQHGLRSIDGVMKVKSVKLENNAVSIKAERILMTYSIKAGSLAMSGLNTSVEMRIVTPSATHESISEVFNKLFFSGAELDARACTADEKLAFQKMLSEDALQQHKKKKNSKEAALLREPHSFCFPTGDKVYTIGTGIAPPKPILTPDPEYDALAKREGVQATSTFALAVGEDGLPLDALLITGDDGRINFKAISALRGWTFKPAARDGKPVPVMISVEFNFRLI